MATTTLVEKKKYNKGGEIYRFDPQGMNLLSADLMSKDSF
jgi:hypothetical protein